MSALANIRSKWDSSGNLVFHDRGTGNTIFTITSGTNGYITYDDSKPLKFGTGGDVSLYYDGSNLQLQPVAADGFLVGGDTYKLDVTLKGTLTVGKDDTGHDVKLFGATAGAYALWDESGDVLILDKADIALGDTDNLLLGDSSDYALTYSGSALTLIPAAASDSITIGSTGHVANTTLTGTFTVGVDDTGHDVKLFGATASAFLLWDESADALLLSGDARLDLTACTVKAANTDGGIIRIGTSAAPVTEDTADMKLIAIYTDNGATSGDNRAIYNKFNLTGAGGGGESFRTYTDVVDVAGGTAHGAHITLGLGTSGSITGLGAAERSTFMLPVTPLTAGSYYAHMAEIFSESDASDISGTTVHAIQFLGATGNATGAATIGNVWHITGVEADNTTAMIKSSAVGAAAKGLRVNVNGTQYWIPLCASS